MLELKQHLKYSEKLDINEIKDIVFCKVLRN